MTAKIISIFLIDRIQRLKMDFTRDHLTDTPIFPHILPIAT